MFVFYHTDGNFLPLASDIINTGIDALRPLEAKAGLDAAMIKNRLGQKVVLMGNIYAVKLCAGAERMKRELKSKLPILMRGRYIYSSNHSIPPTMSFGDYCELVEIIKTKGRY